MTYRTRALVLCEGAALDMKGNVSLISVMGPLILSPDLSGQLLPTLIGIFEDDTAAQVAANQILNATVTVTDPEGETIFLSRQPSPVTPIQDGEAHRINVIAQIPLNLTSFGKYTVAVALDIPAADGPRQQVNDKVSVTVRQQD